VLREVLDLDGADAAAARIVIERRPGKADEELGRPEPRSR
jgi:hypothetical protein